jgi:N-dimethylarginine dimethylaminohydrolase
MTPSLNEFGRLTRVLMKHARDAFVSPKMIAAQWKQLNFSAPPDFERAIAEYDAFLQIIHGTGADVVFLPRDDEVTLDAIYTRDAAVEAPGGLILGNMGKRSRAGEPEVQRRTLADHGASIGGSIADPGRLEGGDLVWLDARTAAVGEGTRTNAEGIRQLKALLEGGIDELLVVPLPDYPGLHDVMHLMSLISPVDRDLAVVYPRLLPDPFRRALLDRGFRLISVPDEEFDSMGTNVLALAPGDCLMLEGNPETRAALERAGVGVRVFKGEEISLKGGGGPTCLTRPLQRII